MTYQTEDMAGRQFSTDQTAVVFDLETVPDLAAARLLLGAEADLPESEVRRLLGDKYRRDGQDAKDAFIKLVLHRIVCIGALYVERIDSNSFWQIARSGVVHIGQRSERDIVSAFIGSLDVPPSPRLVGFNSTSFDLPVLRYRAFALGVPAATIHRGNGRDYWYRFGRDHLDLCDLISGFGASTRPSLAELAALWGMRAKADGIDGSQVEGLVRDGRIEEVAAYCETDVLTTYLLFLRFSLVTGELNPPAYQESLAKCREFVAERLEKRPYLRRYLELLPG